MNATITGAFIQAVSGSLDCLKTPQNKYQWFSRYWYSLCLCIKSTVSQPFPRCRVASCSLTVSAVFEKQKPQTEPRSQAAVIHLSGRSSNVWIISLKYFRDLTIYSHLLNQPAWHIPSWYGSCPRARPSHRYTGVSESCNISSRGGKLYGSHILHRESLRLSTYPKFSISSAVWHPTHFDLSHLYP